MSGKIGPYQLNTIVTGDATKLIQAVPDESVDVIITSPPYNLGSRYAGASDKAIQGKWGRVIQYDDYQDNMPEAEYRDWQRFMLCQFWRVIKPTGAIFYNHRPRIQDGQVWDRFDLIPAGINKRQVIIWKRPKGHNFNEGYFVPSYEWLFLLAKPGYKLNPGCSGFGDVWEFPPAQNEHPAPFPLALPLRAIASSANCRVVLDPFMGSGTTAEAAITEGCNFIGFELTEKWVKYANERLGNLRPLIITAPAPVAQQGTLL